MGKFKARKVKQKRRNEVDGKREERQEGEIGSHALQFTALNLVS